MEERVTDIDTFLNFLNEYGNLCRKNWNVKKEDTYWEQLAEDIVSQSRRYPGEFEKNLLLLLTDELSRRESLQSASPKKEQRKGVRTPLPPRYEKMLTAAYDMIDRMREEPMLRKVYSDVNFYKIINEIEQYREDLNVAESLF